MISFSASAWCSSQSRNEEACTARTHHMKGIAHLIPTRALTALIPATAAISMTAQEVDISDPGLNAAIRDAPQKPVWTADRTGHVGLDHSTPPPCPPAGMIQSISLPLCNSPQIKYQN